MEKVQSAASVVLPACTAVGRVLSLRSVHPAPLPTDPFNVSLGSTTEQMGGICAKALLAVLRALFAVAVTDETSGGDTVVCA